MKSLIGRLLIAFALFAAAAISGVEARRLQRVADTREAFATLRFDVSDAAGIDRAAADYWQGRYDRFVDGRDGITRDPASARRDWTASFGATSPDPQLLLLAANAAYRASQQSALPRQANVQQLDVVLQAYATALKSAVFLPDAAYNYEYVARIRESLGRTRAPASARPDSPPSFGGARRAGDLPAGPTIHGRPGGPPPGTKGEEFEILTPMEFGDREAQPEPTAGGKPLRKG